MKSILVFSVVFLLGLNIWMITHARTMQKDIQLKNDKVLSITTQLDRAFEDRNFLMEKLVFSGLDRRNKTEILSQNTRLAKELSDGRSVILHYQEGVCSPCLLEALLDIEILADSIGRDKILITTNWTNKNKPVRIENFDHLQTIYVRTYNLPVEEINTPMILVVNQEFDIVSIFLPEYCEDFRFRYFNEYLPKFF